ncbi:PaaX family transcriptional regulator [Rhodococcus sp. ABRD24]|uniref:PaaX family transcriptional regulator n=1 Tax=Rhodococcus sp. ABRD24 TaxID=2507582 RepID=UPI00103C8C41|nr:PaaX family transcriptional regulator C-terminal domain-containing protein [Rhodococcus sp. ABRD24]QBJ97311.1 PaaX family transcriptional regulator [Rhodococcus sp. ABRD24]
MTIASGVRKTGSTSAASLLFTLLGEYLRDNDQKPWTSTFVRALGALDYEEPAARKAISRASADGWLESERMGRRVRWQLSEKAVQHFREAEVIAYNRHQPPEWNGTWFLLFTSIPENQRELRHQLRTQLRWKGFGPVGGGVWISPAADAERLASDVLRELDISRNSFSFAGQFGTLGDEYEMVQRAWDLKLLAQEYADFDTQMNRFSCNSNPEMAFIHYTVLVHSWRRLVLSDPNLPAELLPARWVGVDVTARFFAMRDELGPTAIQWFWQDDVCR